MLGCERSCTGVDLLLTFFVCLATGSVVRRNAFSKAKPVTGSEAGATVYEVWQYVQLVFGSILGVIECKLAFPTIADMLRR